MDIASFIQEYSFLLFIGGCFLLYHINKWVKRFYKWIKSRIQERKAKRTIQPINENQLNSVRRKNYNALKRQKLTHIACLLILSNVDGHFDESEHFLITKIMEREGLTPNDLDKIKDMSKFNQFQAPLDEETKLLYLKDAVMLSLIDGELHEKEVAKCKEYAIILGYMPEVIDAILLDIFLQLKKSMKK